MDPATVIDRIRGRTFETGANEPFFLNDREHVFWVQEGYLDIFGVEVDQGNVTGHQPFIARLPQGAMAFGGSPVTGPDGSSCCLMATPSRNAVIAQGERAAIAEDFDLATTIWIDDWVTCLSEFVGRIQGLPPIGSQLIEAEPDMPYPANVTMTAKHRDVVWVSANRPVRFVGRDGSSDGPEIGPESPLLPMSERTWLRLGEDTEISGVYTPTALLTERIWPALDDFHRIVQEYAAADWVERHRTRRVRHQDTVMARQAGVAGMFHGLGDVLGMPADTQLESLGGRTPLESATALVAQAIGIDLEIPPHVNETGHPLEIVNSIVRASRIRARRISLSSGWWRRDGPAFVGFMTDGARPLALLPDGNGRYRAVDPDAGEAFAVDAEAASRLSVNGLMLYAPVPDSVDNGLAAMRYVLRGFRREFAVVGIMALLGGLLALVTPVLTGELLAEVIPRVDTSMWIAYLCALFAAALGTALFDIVRALAVLRIESRIDERLQSAVWIRLLSLPATFFRNYTVGDLADRANGVSKIRQLITGVVAGAVISGIFSIFSFALLFYYSWELALAAGGLVLILIGVTWVFARGMMSHFRKSFDIQGIVDGLVFQMISGLTKLRVADAEGHALSRWAERFAEQKRELLAARKWTAGQTVFNGMFTPLTMLAIFAFIQYVLFSGADPATFGLADFLSFNAAFGQFAGAMTALTAAWSTVISAIPLFERVRPILAARPENIGAGVDPGELAGGIEFSNVRFRYLPEAPNAVDGVSFSIRAGDYVAFVGASGSGKSTLYRLMLGFERPDSGSVFFDDQDLSSLDQSVVRSRMGVVLQNGQLAAASIFKNIVGSSSLTMEAAWEAARSAGLAEDIEEMPMNMHTVLPEGGVGLSGGQKQRLLIARALVRKPRIVLLDEATSALDNRTQSIVQESLKSLSATRVVIAHRLSTIRDVDRIYVMDQGRIVETGQYEELMQQDGVFADLARRQLL